MKALLVLVSLLVSGAEALGDYYLLKSAYKYPSDPICSDRIGYQVETKPTNPLTLTRTQTLTLTLTLIRFQALDLAHCSPEDLSRQVQAVSYSCFPKDKYDSKKGYYRTQYNWKDTECTIPSPNSANVTTFVQTQCIYRKNSFGQEIHEMETCWDASDEQDNAQGEPWKKYKDMTVTLYHNKGGEGEADDCDSEVMKFEGVGSSGCRVVQDIDYGPCTGSYYSTCDSSVVTQKYYDTCDCTGAYTIKEVPTFACDSSHHVASEFTCTY